MSEEKKLKHELSLLDFVEEVVFNPEKHEYRGTVTGKEYISATTLLKKYGLTPSEYATIPPAILAAKAKYGTAVHESLEKYILGDDSQIIVPEVAAFAEWLEENSLTKLDCLSEQKVFNEYYGVAGTVDLQVWNIIADFKTTASLHMVPVMWQLSIYNFLLNPDEEKYNMQELKVFWFSATGTLTVRDVPLVPYHKLISLLEANLKGDEVWVDETVPTNLLDKVDAIVKQDRLIKTLKKNLKALENDKDVIRASIEDQMKEESLIYVDAPAGVVTITEVSSSRYDSKRVTAALEKHGIDPKPLLNVSTYTRMNIKDKAK